MSQTGEVRAPRRDAVRNRARLIEAAAHAFREEGLAASVNAIAERAGVNVATLYRHFPTKDALIVAVVEAVLEPLVEARDRALALEDADTVLPVFFREAVRLQSENRGLVDALGRYPEGSEVRDQLRRPAIEIVTPLAERAHRDGALREDFDALDLLVALHMLVLSCEGREPARSDRYVEMVVRGLLGLSGSRGHSR
jgi:AcrR family transcriptional regulator